MTSIDVFSVLIRLDGGGAERSVGRMVEPLSRKGVNLTRYAIDRALPGEESDPTRTLVNGSKRGIVRVLTAAVGLAAAIREGHPHIVHLNCEAPEIVGLVAKLLTIGQPYGIVVTDHSMKSWSGGRAVLGFFLRSALKAFGALYVSCFLPDDPDSKGPVVLNPTGAVTALAPGQTPYPRLVVVGRVIDSKRIDDVLVAASACGWPHEVVVIGGGIAARRLSGLASELGLQVHFLGHQKQPWSLVEANDVFVTASAFEGEPLTLIEALQRKLPVLASNIPAHIKVLGAHPGVFASSAELAERLKVCLGRPDALEAFRLPAEQVDRILQERDPDRIADQWRTVYRGRLRIGGANAG